ncbi:MAG TPA: NAD(P)H-hydrate dehydratase [Polyangiaceae bacterium]|jgi:NAD(P)H-hydrate epimerase|nr:NAD(P)H-hydrate dehydratase [Polyangiaceae bacterium]
MTPVLSREEVRELDRRATAEAAIPSLELMERAGRGATELLLERFPAASRVLIVCGAGNNGGDGFVVARHLLAHGRKPTVVLLGDIAKLRGDALANSAALTEAGGAFTSLSEATFAAFTRSLGDADLVVDALFGTGLDRPLEGLARDLVERLNAAPVPKLALDVPSGVDSNTGATLGVAIHAQVTATFAAPKRGLLTPNGAIQAGEAHVISLGIPSEVAERMGYGACQVEATDVAAAIPPRGPRSHKGSSGRVLVIAGSPGKIGAGLLVAEGALRAGAGLVTLAATPAVATTYEARVLEAMTARIDPENVEASLAEYLANTDVVALGPGLGTDDYARRVVEHVALAHSGLVVLDADGITCFAGRPEVLAGARGKVVLTPHPGEMGRLLGSSAAEVEADRFGAVKSAAERSGQTVLLKGAPTLVAAPGERIAVNSTGHPVLATGGAGDVLCGVIAALLVHANPYRAALAGAFVHGSAAAELARTRGVDRGVLAHEVAGAVPAAIARVLSSRHG